MQIAMHRSLVVAMALCLGTLAPACRQAPSAKPEVPAAMDAGVSYPSSAAYDPDAMAVLVGSYADGTIQRVKAPGHTPRSLSKGLPRDGREHVLRIRVEPQGRRIWVLASDALYAYDAGTSSLLRRIEIPELTQHSREHCLPDMAIDRTGAVVLSSAMQPKLWRVDPVSYALTEHPIRVDPDEGKDFGFSALAFAGEDHALYAASATTGALWKIDAQKERASNIRLSQPVWGACALSPVAADDSHTGLVLYIAGGFRDSVQRIRLPASGLADEVAVVQTIAQARVPTDFLSIDRKLHVVSSQLSEHADFNGEERPSIPFRIVSVRLR